MSGSKLLEQAIVDAQALRDSAYKSAQATLIEKFAPQIKEAVEKLLEQGEEEDPAAMAGSPTDALAADIPAGTDFGGAPPDSSDKAYVAGTAKDVPLAATDGEKLCPCPDDEEEVTLNLNLADLADQLKIGREAEEDEEDLNQQPMLGGMQNQPPAAGGTGLAENLELESIELDENVEVNLDEVLSELDEEELDEVKMSKDLEAAMRSDSYKAEKEKKSAEQKQADKDKAFRKANQRQKAGLELEQEKLDPVGQEDGDIDNDGDKDSSDKYLKNRREKIAAAMNENKAKQLITASAQLLKEHQNTIKLVEKKDAQIQKLLEENKNISSTLEEMSQAFKKLEEVNLLNAHLFYQNQVLKSASLNERQKTHIVEAISNADSVSEAKAVYETLINSVGGSAEKERSPKSLNEAISKKSSFRLPHKQAEQPNDPGKDRWLKLAGIK